MSNHEKNQAEIDVLNSLIEICKDGEAGYRAAGDAVEHADMRTLFHMYAQQRAHFGSELNNEVLRRGGEPAQSGHLAASLHRGWIDLKSDVVHQGEASIIDECERGEDVALLAYEEALKKHLPQDLMDLVQTQFGEVRHAHETLRGLTRAAHAG
jgi:uncharacterized protein (TIGR02284 family)